MDFDETPEEAAFRTEVGAFLDAHMPVRTQTENAVHITDAQRELDSVAEILDRGTSADQQTRLYDLAVARGARGHEAVRQVAADIALRTLAA